MSSVHSELARDWIKRWDRQQESFLPERDAQFEALIDAVELTCGQHGPLVVDLGCGPGSVGSRLIDRIPGATVVGIDADPLLLELGRAAHADLPGLRLVDADLNAPDWPDALGLDRPADAIVSITALHWLDPAALAEVYVHALRLLRPAGLLVNCDELERDGRTSPALTRLDRAMLERQAQRRFRDGNDEGWGDWWEHVLADPHFADAVAERKRRGFVGEKHGCPSGLLSVHVDALHAAGFVEVGTVWQRGEVKLLCAVAGPLQEAEPRGSHG
ncbi:class I SAM-dependent methyltransferase [Nocardia sp. NPDC051570]|uniref:class I SAM-dependent methyltransferase n=1 Tax=Nocardia sp. NPDC051570 TaxID=3364324 RepID=UPI00378E9008